MKINMKRCSFLFGMILMSLAVYATPPTWSVNPSAYNYSMNVVAKLNVDCIDLANPSNIVGAFVGNDCRGVDYAYNVVNGEYLAFSTVYSNVAAGETVTFKIYDASADQEYDASDSVLFQDGASFGFAVAPFELLTNYQPTSLTISNLMVLENELNPVVGGFTTVDQDNTMHTYSLINGDGDEDNANFSITGDSLFVVGTFDFETKASYNVRVSVNDGSCTFEEKFVVIVVNVGDAPTNIFVSDSVIDENMPAGSVIGQFTSEDADVGETYMYSLVAGAGDTDNGIFNIVDDELVTRTAMDFEAGSSFSIRVRTEEDLTGLFFEKAFNVFINDVNEAPVVTGGVFEIEEGVDLGTVVGLISFTDEDADDVITTSFLEITPRFEILDEEISTAGAILYEDASSYTIIVVGTDAGGLQDTGLVIVNIVDRVEFDKPLGVNKIITPNGDGINDVFAIENVAIYNDFSLMIFNGSGHIIYQVSTGYDNTWGATSNGEVVDQGAYYYVLQSNANQEQLFKGAVTVIR